jgi:hypothetical protein
MADAGLLPAAVAGDRLEALFTVALAMGFSQPEDRGLQREDVDPEGRNLVHCRGRAGSTYFSTRSRAEVAGRSLFMTRSSPRPEGIVRGKPNRG